MPEVIEEWIESIIRILKEQGYTFIGDFNRDQLKLDEVEKCVATTGMGSCSCSLNMDLIVHEKLFEDIALIIFFEWINYVKPLDPFPCSGSTKIEVFVESENTSVKVYEDEVNACAIVV